MSKKTSSSTLKDRRKARRFKVNLQARWERNRTRRAGTVASISRNGCFILTGGRVKPQDAVRIQMTLPNKEVLTFLGEVVDFATEIGFAARFTWMEVPDELSLEEFLQQRLAAEGG